MTISAVSEKEAFLREFESLEQQNAPEWLRRLRQNAIDHFLRLEFPTTKNEDWRFTNITPILKTDFQKATGAVVSSTEGALRSLTSTTRLTFVNGRFNPDLSVIGSLPPGVAVGNLLQVNVPAIEQHIGRYARFDNNIFAALNTALLQDAAIVYIPDGTVLETPIELLFISSALDTHIHPRTLLVAGKATVSNIVENYIGSGDAANFSNAVTEIVLDEGAVMEHCRVQQENHASFHLAITTVHQARDSAFTSFVATIGSKLSRTELNIMLSGTGASCSLNGVYLIGGKQHADHQTAIDHAKPHGTSQELYKGILDGASSAVFNGKIIVRKDAQRTDAKQTNKNLLLSDGARVNTKPQLEILANDVKCNHGATIGHLEEASIFYMRSRGMSELHARMLLMHAFINEVTGRVKSDSVRQSLNAIVSARLQQFAVGKEVV